MGGFRNSILAGLTLVREAIRSPNYVAGVSGWTINQDGSAEFSNVVIRGSGTADPIVVGPSGMPQVIIRTTATNGLIVFPTNRPIEQDAATAGSAVINSGAANERAELQITGPTVNGAPLGVRLVLGSRPQDASDVARFSVQDRTGTTVFFTVDGDQVLATGRPLTAERAAASDVAMRAHITGEAQPRLTVAADGGFQWGPGTAGPDTNLYRGAAGVLQTDDTLEVLGELHPNNLVRGERASATDSMYESRATGDSFARWFTRANGDMFWGSGSALQDVELHRSAANELKVEGSLVVTGGLDVQGATTFTSWTPSITAGGGTATLSTTDGWYYEIGDMVYLEAYFVIGTAGSGATVIQLSLPVTPYRGSANRRQNIPGGVRDGGYANPGPLSCLIFAGGAGATINRVVDSAGVDVTGAALTAGSIWTIIGWIRKA